MKLIAHMSVLLLMVGHLEAKCPSLSKVIPQLKQIERGLTSQKPVFVMIDGVNHKVQKGFGTMSTVDMIRGNYRGYVMHRLKENKPGVCEYVLTDDRTPVVGHFILQRLR